MMELNRKMIQNRTQPVQMPKPATPPRNQFASQDAARVQAALFILMTEYDVSDYDRKLSLALHAISGGRNEFQSSYRLIKRYLTKSGDLHQLDADEEGVFSMESTKGIQKGIKRIEELQKKLGFDLIQVQRATKKGECSTWRLPIVIQAEEAYWRARETAEYKTNPGKAIENEARKMARENIAKFARPETKKDKDEVDAMTEEKIGKSWNTVLRDLDKDRKLTELVSNRDEIRKLRGKSLMGFLKMWGYVDPSEVRDEEEMPRKDPVYILREIQGGRGVPQGCDQKLDGGEEQEPEGKIKGSDKIKGVQMGTLRIQPKPETHRENEGFEKRDFQNEQDWMSRDSHLQCASVQTDLTPLASPSCISTCISSSLEEGQRALDVFEETGFDRVDFGVVEVAEGQNVSHGFMKDRPISEIREEVAVKMEEAQRNDWSVVVRPRHTEGVNSTLRLLQMDDVELDDLEVLRDFAFMTLETSPDNFQALIAVEADEVSFGVLKREMVKHFKSDDGANGSVRLPGSLNTKPKHRDDRGGFPTVRLVETNPGLVFNLRDFDGLLGFNVVEMVNRDLLEARIMVKRGAPKVGIREGTGGRWPSYYQCIEGAPMTAEGKPDRSKADFVFARTALDWGFSAEDVANCLMEESEKAQERGWKDPTSGMKYAMAVVNGALRSQLTDQRECETMDGDANQQPSQKESTDD